jgi:hypothetical protein
MVGLQKIEWLRSANLMNSRDNEKPSRVVKVHAFQAKGRPITNEEVGFPFEE